MSLHEHFLSVKTHFLSLALHFLTVIFAAFIPLLILKYCQSWIPKIEHDLLDMERSIVKKKKRENETHSEISKSTSKHKIVEFAHF